MAGTNLTNFCETVTKNTWREGIKFKSLFYNKNKNLFQLFFLTRDKSTRFIQKIDLRKEAETIQDEFYRQGPKRHLNLPFFRKYRIYIQYWWPLCVPKTNKNSTQKLFSQPRH